MPDLPLQDCEQERVPGVKGPLAGASRMRVMARVVRAVRIMKKEVAVGSSPAANDRDVATRILIKEAQSGIVEGRQLGKTKVVGGMELAIDQVGVWRVDGRVPRGPAFTQHEAVPIYIPKGTQMAAKIMRDFHENNLRHSGGPSSLLACSRRLYWVAQGRRAAKTAIRRCHRCARRHPEPLTPRMIELDERRVRAGHGARPFDEAGVDLAGPWTTKQLARKGTCKRWLAIFVCYIDGTASIIIY